MEQQSIQYEAVCKEIGKLYLESRLEVERLANEIGRLQIENQRLTNELIESRGQREHNS